MTITALTPAATRTAAATAAKMRKSEERWAGHLRDRDWAVISPDHVAALEHLVRKHAELLQVEAAEVWAVLGMVEHVPSC